MNWQDADKKYLELAEKLMRGSITPAEEKDFFDWYNAGQDEPVIVPPTIAENEAELKKKIWEYIQEHKEAPVKKMKNRTWFIRIAAAACIAGFVILSVYLLTNGKPPHDIHNMKNLSRQAVNDILPGGNRAILTLSDGSTIILDSAKNGKLTDQDAATVLKVSDGHIAYDAVPKENANIQYNTLSTPKGGQYAVTLPDGTKVWLNSLSSIRFPVSFTGAQREVELTGEGYFEVVHNQAQPFIVKTKNVRVQDIGTAFNINAYTDEPCISATLIQGLAQLKTDHDNILLHPSKMAFVSANEIKIRDADVEQVMAWKNGLFQFENADLQTVLRQLSRWYDVEVVYEGRMPAQTFSGGLERSLNLSQVLNALQTTGVHFRIERKKLIVMP